MTSGANLSHAPVRAVVFDVYGVIEVPISHQGASEPWVCETLVSYSAVNWKQTVSQDEVLMTGTAVEAELRAVVGSRDPVVLHPLFWRHLGSRIAKRPLDAREVQALFLGACDARNRTVPIFDDVRPCLEAIVDTYKLAVLSNGNSSRIRALLDAAGLSHFFEEILVSGEWQYRKPDPQMLEWIVKCVGVTSPTECVVVGDRLDTDVVSASKAGARSILVARPDADRYHLIGGAAEPDAMVGGLQGVQSVLHRWSEEARPGLSSTHLAAER